MNLSRRVFDDISQLIGCRENPTPLVRLNRLPLPGGGEIFAKLEWMNPFGSIKDRTARYLLEGLRRDGKLSGRKIVEPTSGNTDHPASPPRRGGVAHAGRLVPDRSPEGRRHCARAQLRHRRGDEGSLCDAEPVREPGQRAGPL
ncbi:MAG: hypothetical protein B7Z62_09125 [Deltaproteobacteria bacterium 37-65-8]|nr:MAG: hypothetical protein B7Z62_09125 [Deltaproteobacteria bacterium 37-65-8]